MFSGCLRQNSTSDEDFSVLAGEIRELRWKGAYRRAETRLRIGPTALRAGALKVRGWLAIANPVYFNSACPVMRLRKEREYRASVARYTVAQLPRPSGRRIGLTAGWGYPGT